MPEVVRNASTSVSEPVSRITCSVITVTDFGVSRSGAVYFFEAEVSAL